MTLLGRVLSRIICTYVKLTLRTKGMDQKEVRRSSTKTNCRRTKTYIGPTCQVTIVHLEYVLSYTFS